MEKQKGGLKVETTCILGVLDGYSQSISWVEKKS